jgi:hypothetical protein
MQTLYINSRNGGDACEENPAARKCRDCRFNSVLVVQVISHVWSTCNANAQTFVPLYMKPGRHPTLSFVRARICVRDICTTRLKLEGRQRVP